MAEKVEQTVTVNGQYQPNVVTFQKGDQATLTFKRVSESGCLDTVQSHDFGFQSKLPLNEEISFTIPTDQAGEFEFACGMNMVKGKVIVQ
ncbi:cupredoxin domain-containing protein [Fructobacillus tropaeoli]|uniref:cupredoxin domain-containing protein n=1 Tax=Fructobacillus tropaeoli TaxID=709323 RepID=UPI0014562187|nr:cupredoxin domain-containing protein [Fructobacillus tropaeoli]NLS37835.1 cupredoxin domain-containing protein [Fructobacillus tropaeoli]